MWEIQTGNKEIKSFFYAKKIKYLPDFKWQSPSIYFTPKIHKCESNQKPAALANDDYIDIYQPDDLKGRPIISGSKSPT